MRAPGTRALQVFEAYGRHRSFGKAALELSISPGAVSQQVKALERELGVTLFRRTVRGVEFTAEGERYYIDVRRSLDLIDEATRRLRGGGHPALVTISVEASLAASWLVPRLPDFRARHPEVTPRIAARPVRRGFPDMYGDLAIAYGMRSYAGLRIERLMSERLMPLCAPALLRTVGPFDGAAWFRRATLIHDETFGGGLLPDWQAWFETAGFTEIPSAGGIEFSASSLCLAFAAAGGGLALGRSRIAAPFLADGDLVNPTGIEIAAPADYFLVVSPVRVETHPVRAFVDWLLETAG